MLPFFLLVLGMVFDVVPKVDSRTDEYMCVDLLNNTTKTWEVIMSSKSLAELLSRNETELLDGGELSHCLYFPPTEEFEIDLSNNGGNPALEFKIREMSPSYFNDVSASLDFGGFAKADYFITVLENQSAAFMMVINKNSRMSSPFYVKLESFKIVK